MQSFIKIDHTEHRGLCSTVVDPQLQSVVADRFKWLPGGRQGVRENLGEELGLLSWLNTAWERVRLMRL